ncbi:MAG: Serine/threonine-protein kinase PrkC [Planctomycetes bacterium ADurb.Bin126]|nr:MAG: Serine/threonine-protein kinase PrkC [Planctomycetes bacterium ADurb.Bin126]HOD81269.1 serine/threonine-protein kinase [Phycisphaerae bacterium]HQL71597.1 serine/threonine-protein kinase [Phycisphaerae bacterium]
MIDRDASTQGPPASHAPAPPDIPDLELLRVIGSGGYGQVHLARNRVTGRLLAVKTVRLESFGGEREIAALVRYETAMRKGHENLLAIHHVGQAGGFLYYTMDLADDVSGSPASDSPSYRPATLAERLADGPLPPGEALDLSRQLLAALRAVHQAGLAHRDVKPSNCVFVGGQLKLADFGLLTYTQGSVSRVGTPGYFPPDGRMDAGADVYAAGLVLYQMITGLPAEAFPRLGPMAQAAGTKSAAALNRVVLKACQPMAADRFANADEMLAALEKGVPPIRPARAKGPRLTRRRVVVGVIALLAAGGALLYYWTGAPVRVYVNFVSEPFEATIILDGRPVLDPSGKPYTTPCTIPDLPARATRVSFRLKGYADHDAGQVDLAARQEIQARLTPRTNPATTRPDSTDRPDGG